MKIDLSLAPLDKDGPARAPAGADAERGAMGDAFGKAVRDAEGKRSANSNDKAAKSGADPKAPVDADANGNAVDDAADGATTDGEGESHAEAPPLQSLLGALAALTNQKAGASDGRRVGDARADGRAELPGTVEPAIPTGDVAEPSVAKDKGGMKLDVLRMETHFEPRQDGMVLVEAASDKPAAPTLDPKTKAGASAVDALAASLSSVAKAKAANTGSATVEGTSTSAKGDALPPMRFDEALAQLGRGGGDRAGGETNRDGSAAAQSALAELVARRTAAKGADAVSGSGSIDFGMSSTTSTYSLAGQVAGPIVEALGDPGQQSAPSSASSSDAHLRMRAGGGALKTLTIQLHPEHLGTVDVSLRLNEGRLTLELAASRSDTASMLLDDQASLRKLLEHAGFSLDDAAISVVTRDSGQLRTADSGSAGTQQREANGSPSGEGRPETRGQSGGSDEQPGRRRAPSRGPEEASPAKPRSGSTYL